MTKMPNTDNGWVYPHLRTNSDCKMDPWLSFPVQLGTDRGLARLRKEPKRVWWQSRATRTNSCSSTST